MTVSSDVKKKLKLLTILLSIKTHLCICICVLPNTGPSLSLIHIYLCNEAHI